MHYDTSRAALSAPAIDDLLAARVRDGRAPSVAYALVVDGRIVHTGGFADEAVTPVPGPDTAFRVASCTKSFTAVAMLQQRDAGRLDLEAPVSEYLPLTTVPEAAPTVAQLASMAAGFPTDDPWGDRQESLPLDELDRMAGAGFRVIDAPGARFEYSNLGYALLGRVIERASGRRYLDLVREDVLEPLGLDGVAYDRSVVAPGGIATGFARFDGRWEPQPFAEPGAFSPIGGVFATSRALARWAAWLAGAWRPDASDAVLAAASRREMQAARIPNEGGGSYGYGLFLDEH
ncbi:MAG TPA: serine hydrolase domain-containing protein, partial [Amnibacterium sp.]